MQVSPLFLFLPKFLSLFASIHQSQSRFWKSKHFQMLIVNYNRITYLFYDGYTFLDTLLF